MAVFEKARSRLCRAAVGSLVIALVLLTGNARERTSTMPPLFPVAVLTDMATPADVGAVQSASVPGAMWRRPITLGPKATKRILATLATGGTGLAVIACQAVVPIDIKPYCGIIVSSLTGLVALGESGDKCLEITVGLGLPPVRTRLVPCPASAPMPETDGPDVLNSPPWVPFEPYIVQ